MAGIFGCYQWAVGTNRGVSLSQGSANVLSLSLIGIFIYPTRLEKNSRRIDINKLLDLE